MGKALRRGKILPRRHQLPGVRRAEAAKNPCFIDVFGMAQRLLTNWRVGCGRGIAAFVGV
jgi:hypothetical protein